MVNVDVFKKTVEDDLKEIKKCKIHILMIQEKNNELCEANNKEIERLNNVIENRELSLEENLSKSGEKKIETSRGGWAHYRAMPDQWIYGDNTINDIKTIYPKEANRYIKVEESLIKTNIKKDCELGKIGLPSVTKKPQPDKFEYKLPDNGGL